MPFNLTNAPASFQKYITKIFFKKFDIFVIVYLDNIFIYTENNRDRHITIVQKILEQPWKFLLYVNLKKCRFHQKKFQFFSYMMSFKGIRMENKRIEALKQWLEPQSIQDI